MTSRGNGGGFEDYYLISESFRTRHGNHRLADALAADLGDDLRLGQSVTNITRMESDAIVQTGGGERLHADAVVMTVPPTAGGSYSFPAPGQVTRQGPTLVDGLIDDGLAPLCLAGEHTSYGFTGYMEGALQSGLRAARTALATASTSPH